MSTQPIPSLPSPTATFLERALVLAERGIPVAPVPPREKAAKLTGWPELATTNLEQLKLWNIQNPEQNTAAVAFATVGSFWMLDCDVPNLRERIEADLGIKLPSTYTVRSSKGVHIYWKQTPKSIAMGNVPAADVRDKMFDAQVNRKYVVGPGSVHPSGVMYTVIDDSEIVEAPDALIDWILAQRKEPKGQPAKPTATGIAGGLTFLKVEAGLIPAFNRLGEMVESDSGLVKLGYKVNFTCPLHDPETAKSHRSFGFELTPEGYAIFRCHHDACGLRGDIIHFVELFDGVPTVQAITSVINETYGDRSSYEAAKQEHELTLQYGTIPSDAVSATVEGVALKPQETATVATTAAVATAVVVAAPRKKKIAIENLPVHPDECLGRGLIGELTRLLTTGTFIPPQFVYQDTKVALGHILDGRLGFPAMPRIHMRRYGFKIGPPASAKGESWNRTMNPDTDGCFNDFLTFNQVHLANGIGWGSGQFMAKYLSKHPNSIVFFDEGKALFEQAMMAGSTLGTVFLNLFESNSVAQGSFKNGDSSANNVHMSVSGCFTEKSFNKAFMYKGAGGDGFLSRVELAVGVRRPVHDDWPLLDYTAIARVVEKIKAVVDALGPKVGGVAARISEETPGAKALRFQFEAWLQEQDDDLVSRLVDQFKRDLALRALFSGDVITEELTQESIMWAKHQLALRERFWPVDQGSPVQTMERLIMAALRANPAGVPRWRLENYCHVERDGSGGYKTFNEAMNAVAAKIKPVRETRKGVKVYGLKDPDDSEE